MAFGWRLAALVFVSAIPDTIVVAVLKDLFVDRYGVSAPWAQAFMAINLPGALVALPVLALLRRRMSLRALLVSASLLDAALLLAMWSPVGFGATLALRAVEGVTDVIVFAALFEAVRRRAGHGLGLALGAASTALTLGLAVGVVLGGVATKLGGATTVFPMAAAACLLVGLAGWSWRDLFTHGAAPTPLSERDDGARGISWPPMAMTFADRATGGVLTATLPIMFASFLGFTPVERGLMIGLPLAFMALGTAPAGWLVDRHGAPRVRLCAGLVYAAAIVAVGALGGSGLLLTGALLLAGAAGAALLASSLDLAALGGHGAIDMGGFRAAGDLGYFFGTATAAAMAAGFGGASPALGDYSIVLFVFAGFHCSASLAALGWLRASVPTARL